MIECDQSRCLNGWNDVRHARSRPHDPDRGPYCFDQGRPSRPGTLQSWPVVRAPNRGIGLSGVRVCVPPGPSGRREAVSVSTFRADGWLMPDEEPMVIRVAPSGAEVLMTIHWPAADGIQSPPTLRLARMNASPAGSTAEPPPVRRAYGNQLPGRTLPRRLPPGSRGDSIAGGRTPKQGPLCQPERWRDVRRRQDRRHPRRPKSWPTSKTWATSRVPWASGSGARGAGVGSKGSAWCRARGSRPRISNAGRCLAATGCHRGCQAANIAAAAVLPCRCGGSAFGCVPPPPRVSTSRFPRVSSTGPRWAWSGRITFARRQARAVEALQVILRRRMG